MRILFSNRLEYCREYGNSKVTMELSQAMDELGWECDLMGGPDLAKRLGKEYHGGKDYSLHLRLYLHRHAKNYQVVDFPYDVLPYPRKEFSSQVLMVGRSVLLAEHFEEIEIPVGNSLRARIGNLLRGRTRRRKIHNEATTATLSAQQTDLLNVANKEDRSELIKRGIDSRKIIVVPYGIAPYIRARFDASCCGVPPNLTVAFVGTFDPRKGAIEFPRIVKAITNDVPGVKFRLIGTRGMHPTAEAVLAKFPKALHAQIEVVPYFEPAELPELLCGCSVGMFPSYIEGFGFGVLEMLSASLPVIAYNAPGPPMMLPPEYLVSRGDAGGMAAKIVSLLKDRSKLERARRWAKMRSQEFTWQSAARQTVAHYCEALEHRATLARSANGI